MISTTAMVPPAVAWGSLRHPPSHPAPQSLGGIASGGPNICKV